MVVVQVRRWTVYAAIEAFQDETSGGEGAFETRGARAEVGCCGRDSGQEVGKAILPSDPH